MKHSAMDSIDRHCDAESVDVKPSLYDLSNEISNSRLDVKLSPLALCSANTSNEASYSQSSKSNEKIKSIPGISYILILVLKNASKQKILQYDCVMCSTSEAKILNGEAFKVHLQSRSHLLNVLELENNQLYEKYRKNENISIAKLQVEVLRCQSASDKLIATSANYNSKRYALVAKIVQLRNTCRLVSEKVFKQESCSSEKDVFKKTCSIELKTECLSNSEESERNKTSVSEEGRRDIPNLKEIQDRIVKEENSTSEQDVIERTCSVEIKTECLSNSEERERKETSISEEEERNISKYKVGSLNKRHLPRNRSVEIKTEYLSNSEEREGKETVVSEEKEIQSILNFKEIEENESTFSNSKQRYKKSITNSKQKECKGPLTLKPRTSVFPSGIGENKKRSEQVLNIQSSFEQRRLKETTSSKKEADNRPSVLEKNGYEYASNTELRAHKRAHEPELLPPSAKRRLGSADHVLVGHIWLVSSKMH